MSAYELSYLLRYNLVLLLGLAVVLLFIHSLQELRWNMKNSVTPLRGFFLMSSSSKKQQTASSFSLFHTTTIGSALRSDIRLKSRLVGRRHAIIYLYEGIWYLRPATTRFPVFVNGTEILHPIPLENQDVIGVGDMSFSFINERQTTEAAHLTYRVQDEQPVYPKKIALPKYFGAFGAINLFTLISGFLLTYLIPQDQTKALDFVKLTFVAFWFLSNVYYFILPRVLKNLDSLLLLLLMQLTTLGLLFQIRLELVAVTTKAPDLLYTNLYSQIISLLLAYLLFPIIVLLVARTRILESLVPICAVLTPLFLLVTLVFGRGAESHGATLWISLGGFSLQLTEFAKITYLIVLAAFFKNRTTRRNQIIFAGWAALVFLLILLLPDLGSIMILLPTTLVVYVVMTSEYLTTVILLAGGTLVSTIAFSTFPHVQRRLAGWTTLWTEVNDSNRQIVYGLQAIARGGLIGRGIGNGSPGGIPLASSDMVFAIIAEELGIISGLFIMGLFIILWLRAARITITTTDGYSSSLALGIGTLAFMEAAVVITGVAGLLPLTGVTLPLIARGGSSVMTIVFLFAILSGLSARRRKETDQYENVDA